MHKKAKKLSKAQQRAKLLMKSMMSESKAAVKHVPKKKTVRKAKAAVHKVKAVRKKKVKAPAASPVSSILGNLMASTKKAHAQRVQKQAKVVKKVKQAHKKKRVAMHKKAKKLSKAQPRAKLLITSMMSLS